MRARLLTLVVVAMTAVTLVLAPVVPVAAEDLPEGGLAGGTTDPAGNPTAIAADVDRQRASGDPGAGGGGTGSSGSQPRCEWVEFEHPYLDGRTTVYFPDGRVVDSPTGRWVRQVCDGQPEFTVYPAAVASEPAPVDASLLAEQARRSVSIPAPPLATSPPADDLVVQVPTWLWVDSGWWQGYSATATAGAVSSTATARPVRATWTMGDGSTVSCGGPGTRWTPGQTEDATDCSHVYTTSSDGQPGGTYPLGVRVEFDVSWTSNIGASGTLAGITREASTSVRVREIQAIETR